MRTHARHAGSASSLSDLLEAAVALRSAGIGGPEEGVTGVPGAWEGLTGVRRALPVPSLPVPAKEGSRVRARVGVGMAVAWSIFLAFGAGGPIAKLETLGDLLGAAGFALEGEGIPTFVAA